MTETITHSSFTIEQTFHHPVAKVFKALITEEQRRKWFVEGKGFTIEAYTCDYRVDGREYCAFRFKGGPLIENHTVVMDIVENARTVACYSMAADGKRFSVSQITTELYEVEGGTRVVFTELGAHFGKDGSAGRKEGSIGMLAGLGTYLDANN